MSKYIIEIYFIRKVYFAVIRLKRLPPYTGCLPRNDHLFRRATSLHRTPSHEPPLSYNSHPLTMTYCCHYKHLHGVKYSTLDLDFLQCEFIVNILK